MHRGASIRFMALYRIRRVSALLCALGAEFEVQQWDSPEDRLRYRYRFVTVDAPVFLVQL